MAIRAPLLASLVILGAVACNDDRSLPLPDWQLAVDGTATVTAIELPALLDDGRVPDRRLRYRLRRSVTVPDRWLGRPLQLVVPDLAAVLQLSVGGVEVPAPSFASTDYRRQGPHVWSIPASDANLELELVVEHTWTQSAWWGTVPRLLPTSATDAAGSRIYAFNLLANGAGMVALLQIAFAWTMIYVFDRRRRVYLPFAFQAIFATCYPMFVAGWTQRVFGIYDAPVLAGCLTVACAASLLFTHDFFGLARPWRGFWLLGGIVCIIAIAFHDPFRTTRVAGAATIAYVTLVLLYQLAICVAIMRKGSEGRSAVYVLMSWLMLGVTGLPDFMWWLGLGDLLGGLRLASIGLAFFAIFMSLLLSQRHVHSLKNSDTLNAELAQRVDQLEVRRAEIEQLNVELRRQIADRASQIYQAVALANTRGATAHLEVGDVVQGRYRVERAIGAGGMGRIYEVTRLTDARKLALKLPRQVDGQSLARLAREAQIASTLSHPNVVAVVDVDVASAGFLYLIMELVEGASLVGHRTRFGNVCWALPVLTQLADGLAALHRVGIVHRDLKPANVLVTSGAGATDDAPTIKISDFGISLNADSEQPSFMVPSAPDVAAPWLHTGSVTTLRPPTNEGSTEVMSNPTPQVSSSPGAGRRRGRVGTSSFLTRTGHLPGTPLYMAPELIEGRKVLTPAADLFSFGVMAQELLTGKRPFAEAPVLALLDRRAVPVPRSIHVDWPDCPADLALALDACLALDPSARPTASEMVAVLRRSAASSAA